MTEPVMSLALAREHNLTASEYDRIQGILGTVIAAAIRPSMSVGSSLPTPGHSAAVAHCAGRARRPIPTSITTTISP